MVKNPYLMIPLRNINRNKLRSLLLVIGVALTVSLQIGIAVAVDSMMYDFGQSQRNQNYTDITIHSQDQMTIEEIENLIPSITSTKGIGKVGSASIIEINPEFLQEQNLQLTTIIYGCNSNHPDISKFSLEEGRRSIKPGELILSENLARLLTVNPGDTYTMESVPDFNFTGSIFNIAAVMSDSYPFGNYEDVAFIVMNIDDLYTLFTNQSLIQNHIAVEVPNLLDINDLALELSDKIPDKYFVVREKHLDELRTTGLITYRTAMTFLILASYLIEFLFITNIFSIIMKERSSEFGILRAVGTSRLQLGMFILSEILLIAIIGSLLGVLSGIALAVILLAIFKYTLGFASLYALLLVPETLGSSLITGIGVTTLSGAWPLIIAIRQPVVQNIHRSLTSKKKKRSLISWRSAIIAGIILITAGIATALFLGDTAFLGFEVSPVHLLVVILVFLGAIAIEGAIITFIPKIGVKILAWRPWKKIIPMLIATKDVEKELQKSTITIFTAALSLSFILIVGMVSAGLLEAVPGYYSNRFGDNLDLMIETWDYFEFERNFTETLDQTFWWIEQTTYVQEIRATLNMGASTFVFGVNGTEYAHFLDEFILEPVNASLSSLLSITPVSVVISNIFAELVGIETGDTISFQIDLNTEVDAIVSGVFEGNPFIHSGEYIFIDTTIFEDIWNKSTVKWFMADVSDNIQKETAEVLVQNTFPTIKAVKSTQYYYNMIEYSLAVQGAFIHLIFIHSFLLSGLAQFICILISALKMERDVAIMRAVGLFKDDVFRVFVSEAALLGLSGVFIGIINSILGAELIGWFISQSIPISVSIDTMRDAFLFVLWIMVSLLVTFASSYYPSRRASQTNVIAAISGRKDIQYSGKTKPHQLDLKAIAERVQATPDYVEDIKKVTETDLTPEDSQVEQLIQEADSITYKLDLSDSIIKSRHEWYISQVEKYRNREIDNVRITAIIKRYLKFLSEKYEQ